MTSSVRRNVRQLNRNRKHLLIDSHSIRLPHRRYCGHYCRPGISQVPGAVACVLGRIRWRHSMGADAVSVGQHASSWPAGAGEGGDLASYCFSSRDQPALSRPVDRFDPAYHAGRFGIGGRISLDGSSLLLGRHRDRNAHRMVDQTFWLAKIGEGFWPLGFATAVLIKPIFGNGDLESSQ